MTTRKSIRKTAVMYGAFFSLIYFLLIFTSHNYVIEQLSDESRKQRLNKELESFQAIIEDKSLTDRELRNLIKQFQLLLEHTIVVEMENGNILANLDLDPIQVNSVLEQPSGFLRLSYESESLLGLKKNMHTEDRLASITVLETESELPNQSIEAHQFLLFASAILLLILLSLIAVTTYLTLKPIGDMKDDLKRLLSGKQSRLNADVPLEFSLLIKQFNNALELASRRLERHRRLNSDLSHMVKTSITANLSILTNSDPLPPSRADIEFMVSNLKGLNQTLSYRMSKADISGRQMGQTCYPVKITRDVITVMEKIFPNKLFSIQTALPGDFQWPMERQDLSEMLGNLLENAGKWSQNAVGVSLNQSTSNLIIEVADDGPGIPSDATAKVMDRGARLDETVKGFGLGMAIVAEIIDDNFGQMEIGKSETGGARVRVTLPFPE